MQSLRDLSHLEINQWDIRKPSTLVQYLSYHPDPWLCLRLGYIVLVLWYNYNLKYKPFFFSLVSPSIELPSFSSIAFLINCNEIILIVPLHTML